MGSPIVYSWPFVDSPQLPPGAPDLDGTVSIPSVQRDLKINLGTRELVLVNGDLVFTRDADALKQDIDMRFRFFLGEWFADESVGVPYFERVLVKSPDAEQVRGVFRAELLKVEGVAAITQLDFDFDRATRKLKVSWTVQSDFGLISGSTTAPVPVS